MRIFFWLGNHESQSASHFHSDFYPEGSERELWFKAFLPLFPFLFSPNPLWIVKWQPPIKYCKLMMPSVWFRWKVDQVPKVRLSTIQECYVSQFFKSTVKYLHQELSPDLKYEFFTKKKPDLTNNSTLYNSDNGIKTTTKKSLTPFMMHTFVHSVYLQVEKRCTYICRLWGSSGFKVSSGRCLYIHRFIANRICSPSIQPTFTGAKCQRKKKNTGLKRLIEAFKANKC